MKNVMVAVVLLLALAGCAADAGADPQTESQRDRARTAALSATIDGGRAGASTEAPEIQFYHSTVRVKVDGAGDWASVESDLRAIVVALAEPPYSAFDTVIEIEGATALTWLQFDPQNVDAALALSEVWFAHQAEAVGDGELVLAQLTQAYVSSADPSAILEEFTAAGLDAASSSITVEAG